MRVILDECVDRRFAPLITGHEVSTVPQQGWAGLKNGELLRVVAGRFDVLLTVDQNLRHQQRIEGLNLAIVVLIAVTNRISDLKPLAPEVLAALTECSPGTVTSVGAR